MKLSEELYQLGKNKNEMFIKLDEEYCLVIKKMPVIDSELSTYVNAINKAKLDGINITGILDYRLVPGTESYYNTTNGEVSYTTGVFLEDLALGKSVERDNMYISSKGNYDFNKLVTDYLMNVIKFINDCELKAEASQSMFDKLVKDILDLEKYGLLIDPKPLNFFFDKDKGFTIIDVIGRQKEYKPLIDEPFLSSYIYGIVLGYGVPSLYINDELYNGLPKDYQNRLFASLDILRQKIITALRKNGIAEEYIKSNDERNAYRFENTYKDVNLEDMETEVVELHSKGKKDKSKMMNFGIDDFN